MKQCLIEEYNRSGFKISLSPIYEGRNDEVLKVHVNEIYTDLMILKPDNQKEVPLSSYKDIFWSENKRNRTIFVKGEAGVGKSTWCMQLLYTWTKTHDRGDDNCSSDDTQRLPNTATKDMGDALATFDFLIFIQLRYINGEKSIKDVIFSSHLERLSTFESVFQHILKTCSEKVLILLDGLDECVDNLNFKGLNQCTVISTTRPWKYDLVCTEIDLTLKLKGLNVVGVKQLTQKIFKTLAEKKDTQVFISGAQEQNIQFQVEDFLKKLGEVGLFDYVKIPLILIIMAECYLINKSLSSSTTCNMIQLVEIILERGEQKLSDTDKEKIADLKRKWSDKKYMSLFEGNDILSDYSRLFEQLSLLAYQGLTSTQKELSSLVFDEKQLSQYLSQEQLLFCCRFGLLSKSKQFASLLRKTQVCISFYHKLVQEFFAAVWITSREEAFHSFKKCVVCIDDVLEMENVILFVGGLNPHVGSELSKHFVDICNRLKCVVSHDPNDLLSYIDHNYYAKDEIMLQFTNLILRCQEEVNRSSDSFEHLYISYITVLYFGQLLDPVIELVRHSVTYLKAFHLTIYQSKNPSPSLRAIRSGYYDLKTINAKKMVQYGPSLLITLIRSIESCSSLLDLLLDSLDTDCCDVLLTVIPSLRNLEHLNLDSATFSHGVLTLENSNLKTLSLRHICFNDGYVKLKNMNKLEYIYIDDLKMSATAWTGLFDTVQENLKTVVLRDIAYNNWEVNLENSCQLESLILSTLLITGIRLGEGTQLERLNIEKVVMPHASWCSLFASLRSENLQKFRLINFYTAIEGENFYTAKQGENYEINLENSSTLKYLEINGFSVSAIRLAESSQLEELDIEYVVMPHASWCSLFGSIRSENLQKVRLARLHTAVQCENYEINLVNCSKLKILEIYDSSVSAIRLGEGSQLNELDITDVVMPHASWCSLFASLRSENLQKLRLARLHTAIQGENYEINLENCSTLKYLEISDLSVSAIRLGEGSQLKELDIEDVVMPHASWCSLFASLRSENLQKLRLARLHTAIQGENYEINLENCSTLKYLEISDLSVSAIWLGEGSQLNELDIENVVMPHASWCSLFASLRSENLWIVRLAKLDTAIQCENYEINFENCSTLKYLEISDLSVSAIRLGEGSQLNELDIKKVVMPHASWCSLFASLRSENLWNVRLAKLDTAIQCENYEINFENCSKLKSLKISDLSVSAIRLGEGSQLNELDIKKVVMPHASLCSLFESLRSENLRNVRLANLDKLDTAIQGENYEINFENYSKLKSLEISDLSVSAIRLGEVSQLKELDITDVVMPHASWCSLFASLRSENLQKLRLARLHTAVQCENYEINLVNCSKLKILEIYDSSVSAIRLGEGSQLNELNIKKVVMPQASWCSLFASLRSENLQKLRLARLHTAIQGENYEINLENCSTLKYLEISDLSVSAIRLGEGSQLNELDIKKVVMPQASWCSLFASLRSENMRKVWLSNVDFGESDFTLESSSQLGVLSLKNLKTSNNILVTDLQKMKPVYNVLEKFFGSLPYKNLQHLDLKDFDIGNAKLRLADCVYLHTLTIRGVKMSHKSHESLIRSLSGLASLEVLDIANLSVDGILYTYFRSGSGLQRIVHTHTYTHMGHEHAVIRSEFSSLNRLVKDMNKNLRKMGMSLRHKLFSWYNKTW